MVKMDKSWEVVGRDGGTYEIDADNQLGLVFGASIGLDSSLGPVGSSRRRSIGVRGISTLLRVSRWRRLLGIHGLGRVARLTDTSIYGRWHRAVGSSRMRRGRAELVRSSIGVGGRPTERIIWVLHLRLVRKRRLGSVWRRGER